MNIEKTSSKYDILDSGSLLTFDEKSDLAFSITMDSTFRFELVLTFTDTEDKREEFRSEVSGNTITIRCCNCNNPLGTGLAKPIELATFHGKKIYINFWVYRINDTSARKVSYTLYTEKAPAEAT